jgi:Flp pilus assembly protein TadD
MGLFDRLGDRVGRLFDEVFVPEDVRELLEEGRRALQGKNPQAAILPLREAVARRGDFPEARLLLGAALLATGDAHGAVNELSLARDLAPQNPEIAVELGRALLALGEVRPAKIAFRLGLSDERTRPGAYAGLGECYSRSKEFFKAVR